VRGGECRAGPFVSEANWSVYERSTECAFTVDRLVYSNSGCVQIGVSKVKSVSVYAGISGGDSAYPYVSGACCVSVLPEWCS
jgi:hypothetical protein